MFFPLLFKLGKIGEYKDTNSPALLKTFPSKSAKKSIKGDKE
jgi:hypothetical protein